MFILFVHARNEPEVFDLNLSSLTNSRVLFSRVVDERGTMEKVTFKTLGKITLSSKTAVKPLICRLKQAAQMLSKYILGIILGKDKFNHDKYFLRCTHEQCHIKACLH